MLPALPFVPAACATASRRATLRPPRRKMGTRRTSDRIHDVRLISFNCYKGILPEPNLICSNSLLIQKHPVAPIAKTFAAVALLDEAHEHGAQFGFDFGFLHHVFPDAVKAGARGVAAEPDLIPAGGLADEREFRHIRPGATVRATGRADDDFLVGQADFVAQFFDAV